MSIRICQLGRRPYRSVLSMQEKLFNAKVKRAKALRMHQGSRIKAALASGAPVTLTEQEEIDIAGPDVPDTILVVEHDPVAYTMGKRDTSAGIRVGGGEDEKALSAFKDELFKIRRGGGLTLHGPGQATVYPIVNVKKHWTRAPGQCVTLGGVPASSREPKDKPKSPLLWYTQRLETAMITVLEKEYEIFDAETSEVGVWISARAHHPDAGRKIGLVGIQIAEWCSMHGMALNVEEQILPHFEKIVMCELEGKLPCALEEYLPIKRSRSVVGDTSKSGEDTSSSSAAAGEEDEDQCLSVSRVGMQLATAVASELGCSTVQQITAEDLELELQ